MIPDRESIQYRVIPVTRYFVTRYHADGNSAGSSGKGEFESPLVAFEVAYALCREEHERLGWPPGDERIMYPNQIMTDQEIPA